MEYTRPRVGFWQRPSKERAQLLECPKPFVRSSFGSCPNFVPLVPILLKSKLFESSVTHGCIILEKEGRREKIKNIGGLALAEY